MNKFCVLELVKSYTSGGDVSQCSLVAPDSSEYHEFGDRWLQWESDNYNSHAEALADIKRFGGKGADFVVLEVIRGTNW